MLKYPMVIDKVQDDSFNLPWRRAQCTANILNQPAGTLNGGCQSQVADLRQVNPFTDQLSSGHKVIQSSCL
jgi:hypothetical protein